MRLRDNGESVALVGGEREERGSFKQTFDHVIRRWREICGQCLRITVVS
jgi:vitamin B12/bleomycin/antimicrobial peptide transport system ATP-binding/permease protein